MIEKIELGPVPFEEDCKQVGKDSPEEIRAEVKRYAKALKKRFAKWLAAEPDLFISVTSHYHEFGTYYEAVACAPEENEKAVSMAWKMEEFLPETWAEAEQEIDLPE